MAMPELGIHQGDDGFEDFQSLPSSDEPGEIDCNAVGRSVEPQAEEAVRHPSELGNDKEQSSLPGRELGGGDKCRSQRDHVFYRLLMEWVAAAFAWHVICSVLALFLVLCSRSSSGELFMNHHEVSKDLHLKILEIRIVETPLYSVRSIAQDGTQVLKLARHDFLLLRTAGDKWYKAEKHGSSSGQAGIHFYPVLGPGAETTRFRSRISVDFSLAQALDIMKDHKLDYSLWGENCWKYAHARAEAILNSCIEVASDDSVQSGLKKGLENLMDTRRRMPNEVVDIVQDYNILRGGLFSFTLIFCSFLLGFRIISINISSYFKLATIALLNFAIFYIPLRNPILLTYNLTWLATAYRWPFLFLSFFGYYVGVDVYIRGMDSLFLELKRHSQDPFLRTAISERGGVDLYTISRANYHRDNSTEDQRGKWPPRTLLFGVVILTSLRNFETALGYSNIPFLCSFLVWMAVHNGETEAISSPVKANFT